MAILEVCKEYKDYSFIFTKANADAEGRVINQLIDKFASENDNIHAFTSLGMVKYLSAVKYATMVIGNSSSGLLETPSFGIPTINIGDRQKGRLQASSIINCAPIQSSIREAFALAISKKYVNMAKKTVNPYGNGDTSNKVVDVIKEYAMNDIIDLKKKFYDYEVE
jgi:GDP/UDP-N,N'-diacetylbacillosamine 2-epimerase (hydrolysing)